MNRNLGALYLDAAAASAAATAPIVINRFPTPGESGVRTFGAVNFWIIDPRIAGAGLAAVTRIWVTSIPAGGGAPTQVLAYDQAGGGFHANYLAGSSFTVGMSPGSAVNDEHRVTLVRNFAWTSSETVIVDIEARTADAISLAAPYTQHSFTVEDIAVPRLASVVTRGLRTLRVTFTEPINRTGGGTKDATTVRAVTGGVTYVSPDRITAPGGAFTTDDVGRFLGVVGSENVIGDSTHRIAAQLSTTQVQVTAPAHQRFSPFTAAVTSPAATASVGPYRLLAQRSLTPWQDTSPPTGLQAGVSLGAHELVGAPTSFTAEWFWRDAPGSTYGWVRAVVRAADEQRTMYFGSNDDAIYNAVALATISSLSPTTVTFTLASEAIIVSIAGVAAGTFYVFGAFSPIDIAEPAFTPIVIAARAVGADEVPSGVNAQAVVDLTLANELTAGAPYVLFASLIEDLVGNIIDLPCDAYDDLDHRLFVAEEHPFPAERSFDLYYGMTAEMNRQRDDDRTLKRFLAVRQEVANLLLAEIDKFTELWDIDLTPEAMLDTLLGHLANPFGFAQDLNAHNKRRLLDVLTRIYQRVGLETGMENVLTFFFGSGPAPALLPWDVRPYTGTGDTWVLGTDYLGVGTYLGVESTFQLYAFEVESPLTLTATQRTQAQAIIDYMKPSHTHLVRLIEP